jgi:mono/diheme cytochrome c family protein
MSNLLKVGLLLAAGTMANAAMAQDSGVSVEKGARIAIIGGCHDCHTVGYGETNGKIDPAAALTGNPVGYNGPWGTSYAVNLRLVAAGKSEDEWVKYLQTFEATPPMPWFNVHALDESEMRSLYQYIVSLGEPGEPAPAALPPGEKPKTPYLVFAPPTMP